MISYGSHFDCAEMLLELRSHQLGEGQSINTGMSGVVHPFRPVYGSQHICTEMSRCARSHQLGEGLPIDAEMSCEYRPSQPVYGSLTRIAEMPLPHRSHQLGEPTAVRRNATRVTLPPVREGSILEAQMSCEVRPSRLVLESHFDRAEMPIRQRSQGEGQKRPTAMSRGLHPSHSFTRGQLRFAEMPFIERLLKEGSSSYHSNVTWTAPFPTSFGPVLHRRNATTKTPNITRGHHSNAAMLVKCRLATKEIQYGHKI